MSLTNVYLKLWIISFHYLSSRITNKIWIDINAVKRMLPSSSHWVVVCHQHLQILLCCQDRVKSILSEWSRIPVEHLVGPSLSFFPVNCIVNQGSLFDESQFLMILKLGLSSWISLNIYNKISKSVKMFVLCFLCVIFQSTWKYFYEYLLNNHLTLRTSIKAIET